MRYFSRLKRKARQSPIWRDLTRPFRRLGRGLGGDRHRHDASSPTDPPSSQSLNQVSPGKADPPVTEASHRTSLRRFRRRWRRRWREFRYWWPTWRELRAPIRRWRRRLRHARRDYRQVWLGFPAGLALLGWAGFALLLVGWTPARVEYRYYVTAHAAMSAGEYGKARVAFERLLQMDTRSNDAYLFGLALSLKGLGQEQEAAALLANLAPLDSAGYPPAHMLIARVILANPNSHRDSLDSAASHLKRILAVQPENFEARMMLGQLYTKTGQWEQAKEYLETAYPSRKEAALTLALVAGYQRDETGFMRWAEQARVFFKAQVEARPGEPLLRIYWAEATLMLGEYKAALNILETGIMQSGDAAYYQMAARVYSEWSRKVAQTSPDDLGRRLHLIQCGLDYAANNEQLLLQLIALSQLSGREAGQARAHLNQLLAQGGDTAMLHLCLGIDAWQRQRVKEARQHFSLAYEMAPQMPYVANNMAMILALGEEPDLPRALGIIQSVVDKFPKDPHFRDTRGRILGKLGRWQEAVRDLEYALPLVSAKGSTHALLAEAYRHLGLEEMALQHEKLARLDQKKEKIPAN